MNNLRIYEKVRACPKEALKTIQAGKLKGKSDINPVWRIKTLTELFGPCGIGWKTYDEQFWTTPGANGEVIAWCSLKLVYREDVTGPWSDPVNGVGGSMLVDTQKGNLTSNDEAYKMAHTDAISVACKQLGVAADVYWDKDKTKYDKAPDEPTVPPKSAPPADICARCGHPVAALTKDGQVVRTVEDIVKWSKETFNGETYCWNCAKGFLSKSGEAG